MPTAPRVANYRDVLDVVPVPESFNTYAFRPDFGRSLDLPTVNLDADRAALTAMLTSPGQSPYTPELSQQALDLIRRRQMQARDEALAASASDFLTRGGTGSSTEYFTRNDLRGRYDQAAADAELQFLLGASDRAAEDRRFRVQTALGLYGSDVDRLEAALGRQFNRGTAQEGYGFQARESDTQRRFLAGESAVARRFQSQEDAIARAHEEKLAQMYMAQLAQQQAEERKRRRRAGIAGGIGAIGGAIVGGVATGGNPLGISAGAGAGSNLGFLFA